MAASGLPKTSSGPIPSLSKAPSRAQSFQRTQSRRLFYPEIPPIQENSSPIQENTRWDSGPEKKEHCVCGKCCAWTSVAVGFIVVVLFLLGAMSITFLRGTLPQFHIRRLNITKLEVETKGQHTHLNADVELLINATNKNSRYELSYGSLKVEVKSEKISLGNAQISPFKQNPGMMSELRVKTGLKGAGVGGEDAQALKENYKNHQAVFYVAFDGSISINFGATTLNGLPLIVLCQNMEQNDIEFGMRPECQVKMFSFL